MILKLFLSLFFFSFPLKSAETNSDLKIRILLVSNSSELSIQTYGQAYITEIKTGKKFKLLEKSIYKLHSATENSIYLSKQLLSIPIKIIIPDGKNYIKIKEKRYRGIIKINTNSNNTFNLVEEVDFEKYLMGVLTGEMGPDWPIEALKAQAVAARTFASKFININSFYDIQNTTNHQVYSGLEKINPRIIEAVNSTRGEVLTYKNKLITAFYHASSGGHTTSPNAIWGEEIIPPLRGVNDPYSKKSVHNSWNIFITKRDLLSFIQKEGSTALDFNNIKIFSKDRSGRAVKILFYTDEGKFKINTKKLREKFGNFDFKSTLITKIIKEKNGYTFYGKGWGHGVGMSQDGAKNMAYMGKNYKKILNFYYPRSEIMDIEEVIKK